jgi:hypothetical protein
MSAIAKPTALATPPLVGGEDAGDAVRA